MPVTTDELTYARSWIATTEETAVFNERFDRLFEAAADNNRMAAINAAIEESLRGQLAEMTLDQPGSASAEGVSYSNTTNITELHKLFSEFRDTKGTSRVEVARLKRSGSR